jgi:putative salt-induced outer membrane protein YdiY
MDGFVRITKWVVMGSFAAIAFSTCAGPINTNTPPKWSGAVSAGFTATRGNSKTTLATFVASLDRKTGKNELLLGANATYGNAQVIVNGVKTDSTTAQNAEAFGQYNRFLFTDRFYLFGRVDGYHDDLASIHYRVTVSLGPGYYFIKTTNTDLSAEIGPGFISESVGDDEENFPTLRAAQKFHQKLSDRARIWETAEITPDLGNFSNYIINAEVGIAADLTAKKTFELQCFLDDSYNSKPAPGKVNNDLKLVVAIGYKF